MAKGENIFKRKDGRWEARYVKGREPSGKLKYGYCYGKTYREAKEKSCKCKAEMLNTNSQAAGRTQQRFAVYCDEWLSLRRWKVRESTYVKYAAVVERHIKPRLGGYAPLDITAVAVERFTAQLLSEAHLAPKTVHDILVVLRGILNYTAAFFPGKFPNIEICYPKSAKQEMRVLSREEQQRFVAYLLEDMDACRFGVLLALLTGLRIGEVCALRWADISVEEKILRVGATMQRLRSTECPDGSRTRIVVGTPKSDTSVRVIPITDYAAELCARMNPHRAEAYVLTGTERYMEPRVLQYRMKKYTQACSLEGVHFHTLRHTFATRAVEVGFEIKSLSEVLGHASTGITLNRYVHASLELKRENMEKLSAAGF